VASAAAFTANPVVLGRTQAPAVAKSGFTPSVRAADALRVGASGRASLRIRTAPNVVTMAEAKKSVKDLPAGALKGKKVLIRCDLNVPLDGKKITDDTRIRASVPTIKYLLEQGARVAISSHLGRPKDGPEDKFSLAPCAARLAELLETKVPLAKDCIGAATKKMVDGLKDGECLLLENVRFYKEEEKNDEEFAKKLADPFDMYVNDAFGTAHRAHGSTAGVTKFLSPAVSGFLLQKELDYLGGAVDDPKRPFAAIVGGSKVSSKIGVIESLMGKCDKIVIGGGMVFTFLKARGLNTGSSLVEEDKIPLAKELEAKAKAKGVKFILPTDVVLADKFAADANTKVAKVENIPDGWMGLDNGPESTKMIQAELSECKTIIWNGPMGVFEMEKFAAGTNDVAKTLAECTSKGCITIIGGGDSVAAVEQAGLADKMSHISTGGGASLELLEGLVLPGVAALDAKDGPGAPGPGTPAPKAAAPKAAAKKGAAAPSSMGFSGVPADFGRPVVNCPSGFPAASEEQTFLGMAGPRAAGHREMFGGKHAAVSLAMAALLFQPIAESGMYSMDASGKLNKGSFNNLEVPAMGERKTVPTLEAFFPFSKNGVDASGTLFGPGSQPVFASPLKGCGAMYGSCHTFLDEISDSLKGVNAGEIPRSEGKPTAAFPWAYEKAAWKK